MRICATLLIALIGLTASAADILWLKTEHDFGAFDEEDGKVECRFAMVNTSDEPVSFVAVRTSCGCTTAHIPLESINPGDTAYVTAIYNPVGRPGRFEKKIMVDIDSEPRRTTLVIRGVVIGTQNTLRNRYSVDSGALKVRSSSVAFGQARRGQAKTDFIEVYNASSEPISPQWENLPPYIRITPLDQTIRPGEQGVYSLLFVTDRTPVYGLLNDSIFIKRGNGIERTRIDITANIVEDFSNLSDEDLRRAPVVKVTYPKVDFAVLDDAPATRTFTITNLGERELKIRRIYTADQGVKVSVDRASLRKGKTATVTVEVDPAKLPSDILNARIQLITNDPVNPITTIRAVGIRTNKSN